MTINEKIRACNDFLMSLAEELKDAGYEMYWAFDKKRKSSDKYLILKGTENEITYYGKPVNSFRFSTHWNWRAPLKKCDKENYIQCLNVDLPFAKKRKEEGGESDPIMAEQVAVVGEDGKYHAVFGEVFDRKAREWKWLETDPKEVAADYRRLWT